MGTRHAKYCMLLLTTILTLAAILVNGWTDAPNAIATCVSTRSITAKSAIMGVGAAKRLSSVNWGSENAVNVVESIINKNS